MYSSSSDEKPSSPFAGEGRFFQLAVAHLKLNLLDCLERLEDAIEDVIRLQERLNHAKFDCVYLKFTDHDNPESLKCNDSKIKLIELHLKAAFYELEAREAAVKELERGFVFQKALCEDKEFSDAYKAFRLRRKTVKREARPKKKLVLPSQNENIFQCFSKCSSCVSSDVSTSVYDPYNTSVPGPSSKGSPGSISEKGRDTMLSPVSWENPCMPWYGMVSKDALPEYRSSWEREFQKTVGKLPKQSLQSQFDEIVKIFAGTSSDSEKQMSPESDLIETSDLKCLSSPNLQNENISDLQITGDQQNKIPKNVNFSSEEKSSSQEADILDRLNEGEKTENDNKIEFLLEESYDMKEAKLNISVKRKMDLPLQSKGKKICTDASEVKYFNNKQHSNICVEGEKKSSVDLMEEKTVN